MAEKVTALTKQIACEVLTEIHDNRKDIFSWLTPWFVFFNQGHICLETVWAACFFLRFSPFRRHGPLWHSVTAARSPCHAYRCQGFESLRLQSAWELSRCAKTSYMEHHRVFALSNDSSKREPTLSHCPFCEGPCQIQADDVSGGLFHLGGSGKHLERHFEMVRKISPNIKAEAVWVSFVTFCLRGFCSFIGCVSLVSMFFPPFLFPSGLFLVELGTENYETSFWWDGLCWIWNRPFSWGAELSCGDICFLASSLATAERPKARCPSHRQWQGYG